METFSDFLERIHAFEYPSFHLEHDVFQPPLTLADKVRPDGSYRRFTGDTILYWLDQQTQKTLSIWQDSLYARAGALLSDTGLRHFGLEIVAAFDVNPQLVGTSLNGIPIFHSDTFEQKRVEYDVNIGVLTVPIEIAQSITDKMVAGGIKAVWNFTPFRIRVPEHIVVQNTSLYAHLALMFNRLNFNEVKK